MNINIKYTDLLRKQIAEVKKETHWLEFKSNYQEVDKLGRYISALANGACLDHEDFAYLYFGVDDETLCVMGTTFDVSKVKAKGNQALELYLRQYITPCIPFEFEEFLFDDGFYDGDYDQYVYGTKTPRHYRNPALMKAMVNVKMIDSQGYGIHNLFVRQKERFLPMPDYNGSTESKVVLHLPGIVIDTNYSLLLMSHNELTLTEIVLLDSVQKGKRISDEAIDMLRKKKLIEGRKPNVYVAKTVAQSTNTKVEYSKHKGLTDKSCEALLVDSLKEHKSLTRSEIDKLLWNTLSDQLTDKQKTNKIGNLLTKLKKKGIILNETKGNISEWRLSAEI